MKRRRVAAAEAEARDLQVEREAAAVAVDEGCAAFAKALAAYADVVSRQTFPLLEAGREQKHPLQSAVQRAVFVALMKAEVPGGLVDWPGFHQLGPAAFAAQDPVPIYPDTRSIAEPASEAAEPETDRELAEAST